MATSFSPGAPRWQVWTDTGGTFTDCLARDPAGRLHRAKVLSTSALRGRLEEMEAAGSVLRYRAAWHHQGRRLPDGFCAGATLSWLDDDVPARPIVDSQGAACRLHLAAPLARAPAPGAAFEVRFAEQAPILAARLVTGAASVAGLPPMSLRLATTRGTNALLERRGAPTALFITRGFGDLLRIGDQQRPDLFALDIQRPAPLYQAVVEVPERLAADGTILLPLDCEAVAERAAALRATEVESAAVAFLHSYRNPAHEQAFCDFLRASGWRHISASAALAPVLKILPRVETAVVDAYLAPIIGAYLEEVGEAVPEDRLHVMTSAGGLVRAGRYRAKDSLLSGPAGGVVGAVRRGQDAGLERLIAFDMGGTSTDVARWDGSYEYRFTHRVGDAQVAAPAFAIETVAAGGGSRCWADGPQLKVGPESAGAHPGPACYGAGGPLTLTDVNLLLGRLDPQRMAIPIAADAARRAFVALRDELADAGDETAGETKDEAALLAGFLAIADERMADAIRRISVRRGYDPRDYSLVAFGGAGGQHACAVAALLGIRTVLLPADAGLLSAAGLGAAVVERFATRQVLAPLEDATSALAAMLAELVAEAVAQVAAEGVPKEAIEVRRPMAYLRLAGQESTLELELEDDEPSGLAAAFAARYQAVYGYAPPARSLEVESLRVIAASRSEPAAVEEVADASTREADPDGALRAFLGGRWQMVPVYGRQALSPGAQLRGPAILFDDHASAVVETGWRAAARGAGVVLTHEETVELVG